jgi:hypothetical protein
MAEGMSPLGDVCNGWKSDPRANVRSKVSSGHVHELVPVIAEHG